jgi:glycosyltransferase involved in cell wall biosynthesis
MERVSVREAAMKVLFVSRLMSGFAASLRDGRWAPTGAPAIHRMMAALAARGGQTRFVFLVRESGFDFSAPWSPARDSEVSMAGFPASVRVLAGAGAVPRIFGRLRGHLAELRQLFVLLAEIRRVRPDAIYFERGGAALAGAVARLYPRRVVLRVLGILPWMWELDRPRGLYHRVLRWAYRAPFGAVICSEDGSGGSAWMARHLPADSPRVALLNGVDEGPAARVADSRTTVLLLGRLEKLRRCDDFVDAVLALPGSARGRLRALVVGDGPLRAGLEAKVAAAGARDVFDFAGALPPEGVAAALADAQVYVMLNDMCCLTNTTLEALRAGLCPVVLDPPAPIADDEATARLLPPDVAVRIARGPREAIVAALAAALARLAADPAEIARRGAAAAEIARRELTPWDARIARELAILDAVAAGAEPLGTAHG